MRRDDAPLSSACPTTKRDRGRTRKMCQMSEETSLSVDCPGVDLAAKCFRRGILSLCKVEISGCLVVKPPSQFLWVICDPHKQRARLQRGGGWTGEGRFFSSPWPNPAPALEVAQALRGCFGEAVPCLPCEARCARCSFHLQIDSAHNLQTSFPRTSFRAIS